MTERCICLNQSVLDFMAERITPQSFVLEFGAGWSSRWFAERCGKLVSVETSAKWAWTVRQELAGTSCDWSVRLVGRPDGVLDDIADVDLMLVDGVDSERAACVRLAWPLLRTGGWLVFDDAQRERHAETVAWMNTHGEATALRWAPGDVDSARERVTMAWQKPPCASF